MQSATLMLPIVRACLLWKVKLRIPKAEWDKIKQDVGKLSFLFAAAVVEFRFFGFSLRSCESRHSQVQRGPVEVYLDVADQ